jgi:pyrimidine-specific ribonucleoside hydrolase
MSILYLLEQPNIDVVAITVSGTGLVHCDAGIAQALGLLSLVGADDVPVACGPEQPLEGFNAYPGSWRAAADDGYGLDIPAGQSPSDLDAPALLKSLINASPHPIVMYVAGPQTNLATALRSDPGLADNISAVFMTGGALATGSSVTRNPDADWNVWIDPVATDEVIRSGIATTIVPLDATNQVPMTPFHLQALDAEPSTPAARAVATMLGNYEAINSGGVFFWDQVTAAILVDESYATLQSMPLAVVLDEDRSVAGRTVLDEMGTPVRVATAVDTSRFQREFLSAISGSDVGAIATETDWTASFDGETWVIDMPPSVSVGPQTLALSNDSEGSINLVFGRLTDGATIEDLEAWWMDGLEQPPFLEVGPYFFADAGSSLIATLEFAEPATYVILGLDFGSNQLSTLGEIDVGE